MGKERNNDEMSDVYRRIRKKRARQRRRRQRMLRRIRIGISMILLVGLACLIIFKFTGCYGEEVVSGPESLLTERNAVHSALLSADIRQEVEENQTAVREYPVVDTDYKVITSDEVQSPYTALLCVDDNKLIAGKNSMDIIYPASMTKVMTLIAAVEHLEDLDDTFTMTYDIIYPLIQQEASRAGFEENEVVKVRDLLYGMILPSGADAAVALAEKISGSEEAFVELMNEKCVQLGLKNTHFTNTTGLHDSGQYTTPLEMAVIMAYAMENETCAQILSTYQYTTEPNEYHPEGILLTSTMFSRMYGDEAEGASIIAGKTGYTMEAGNCLVSYAVKGGKSYVAVSAGASNRWHVIYDAFELYGNYIPDDATE